MAVVEATQAAPPATEPGPTADGQPDAAERRAARKTTYADRRLGDTLVADGYGVRLAVRHGCLVVADGLGEDRRCRVLTKADVARRGGVRRLVVTGTGSLSTPAVRWCAETGVALVLADRDGTVLMAGTPALAPIHGALRRAQALAPLRPEGLELARWLLGLRLAAQAGVVRASLGPPEAAEMIDQCAGMLAQATTVAEAMIVEGQAATIYWSCWEPLALRWTTRDAGRIPPHWASFGPRRSPLSLNARHAVTPGMALVNYGTRLAETEAVLAALALGLDPAMGLAHTDKPGRPALALDLMEAVRHVVEDMVLDLSCRVLRKADFAQLPSGEVRVLAPLSHHLAQALMPALRAELGPVAEHVAGILGTLSLDGRGPSRRPGTTTPLSRANRHRFSGATPAHRPVPLPAGCHGCGVILARGTWCPQCLPEHRRATSLAWTTARRAKLAPVWDELAPRLAQLTPERIMAATGCSHSTAWRWRTGVSVPRSESLDALRALVNATTHS